MRRILFMLILGLAPCGAQADHRPDMLAVDIPKGFELGHQQVTGNADFVGLVPKGEKTAKDPNVEMHLQALGGGDLLLEFVPKGEKVDSWSEMLTVIGIPGRADVPAMAAAANIARNVAGSCARAQVGGPHSIRQCGRDTAVVEIYCEGPTAPSPQVQVKPFEFLVVLVLQGHKDLWMLQRAWHGENADDPANPQTNEVTAAEWKQFFQATGYTNDHSLYSRGLLIGDTKG